MTVRGQKQEWVIERCVYTNRQINQRWSWSKTYRLNENGQFFGFVCPTDALRVLSGMRPEWDRQLATGGRERLPIMRVRSRRTGQIIMMGL